VTFGCSPGTTIFRSKTEGGAEPVDGRRCVPVAQSRNDPPHAGHHPSGHPLPPLPQLTQHLGCFTELTRPYSMPARDPSATGKLKDSLP